MINATDRPICLVDGISLHFAVQDAISTAIALVERQLNRRSTLSVQDFGFYRMFGTHNQVAGVRFDEQFVDSCFDASQGEARNIGTRQSRMVMAKYLTGVGLPAHGLPALRRGLKLMLVELWRTKTILLPTTFAVGSHFAIEMFEHPLMAWIKSYDPASKTEGSGSADARRMYFYGSRLLWATDWQGPKDISIFDIAVLHRAARLYRMQRSEVVIAGGGQLPFTYLAAQALQQFPGEIQYTEMDLHRYSRWMLTGAYEATPFELYQELPKALSTKSRKSRLGNSRKERVVPDLEDPSGAVDAHDSLRRNFVHLQRGHRVRANWMERDDLSYVGREHVDLSSASISWVEAMRAYLYHRTHVKGYRSEGEAVSVLNLLADYLFYYLPWWAELAQAPKVQPPRAPKELSRFAFVSRHTDESLDEFPETLLNVIGWRRTSKESRAIAVHQLNLFFNFVETHFAENEEIAGFAFRNPLNPDFDAPRIKARNKTNKVVIPKNIPD